MRGNQLLRVVEFGQSLWLDTLSRALLVSGDLVSLIQEHGLSGVTLDPAAFEMAIEAGAEYDDAIARLAREGIDAAAIYESLAVEDIQTTADLLHPLYERDCGRDGYVSLQLSPLLACDTAGTLLEARRLWNRVDRPNLMIKVPGTWEGIAAIRQLIREGINVNVTMLFGTTRYRAVAEAYLDGLADRAARGLHLEHVASVAAFSLTGIDELVDPQLLALAKGGGAGGRVAVSLQGEVAVACAKTARALYRHVHSEDRYLALAARGARPQRLLWCTTGLRDAESELKFFAALIGPDTVKSASLQTLLNYNDQGSPAPRLDQGLQEAMTVLNRLSELGVRLDLVTQKLEDEAMEELILSYKRLLHFVELKRKSALR